MDKNLTFGIDCDEVLRSTLHAMVKLYNKEFNDNKTIDDVKDFVVEKSFPKILELTGKSAGEWFFQDHSKELFVETDALPGIIDAINILKKYGKVIVVTYQKSYKNKIDTLNWLEEHGVEPDGVCFLKDKTVMQCDYFIDDNDWNFEGSNAKHGILINAPYNIDKDIEEIHGKSNCITMMRFTSLYDFAKWFDNKQEHSDRFQSLYDLGLLENFLHDLIILKSLKSMDDCNKSLEVLSNFETSLEYLDIQDKIAKYKFSMYIPYAKSIINRVKSKLESNKEK